MHVAEYMAEGDPELDEPEVVHVDAQFPHLPARPPGSFHPVTFLHFCPSLWEPQIISPPQESQP